MARRMFSPEIVNSDAFLEMPPSTQALYFQLGMKADDDGFVNPKMVMRMIGSSEDEIKVLISKRFVLPFENGVVVIKHWRINNFIRKDRYQPTLHIKERSQLFIRSNQSYTDKNDEDSTHIDSSEWKSDTDKKQLGQPTVNHWSTQDRIGKDRLGKDNIYSKFIFQNKPCYKDKLTGKWKALDNGEWLPVDERFYKDIKKNEGVK
jgi:hypothetical protein